MCAEPMRIGAVPNLLESQMRALEPPTLECTMTRSVCPVTSGALPLNASSIAVPHVATHGEQRAELAAVAHCAAEECAVHDAARRRTRIRRRARRVDGEPGQNIAIPLRGWPMVCIIPDSNAATRSPMAANRGESSTRGGTA